jgi:hypothetical protein
MVSRICGGASSQPNDLALQCFPLSLCENNACVLTLVILIRAVELFNKLPTLILLLS